MHARVSRIAAVLAGVLALAPLGAAQALDYPTRPIRVIVPFAASGVTDIVSRIVFDKVGQSFGR
jgi:tripartite-type tricarboxylate transporter receptor subunit TctC